MRGVGMAFGAMTTAAVVVAAAAAGGRALASVAYLTGEYLARGACERASTEERVRSTVRDSLSHRWTSLLLAGPRVAS